MTLTSGRSLMAGPLEPSVRALPDLRPYPVFPPARAHRASSALPKAHLPRFISGVNTAPGGAHVIGGTFYAWWFVPEGMGMMFLGWLVSVPCVVVASWVAARWRGVDKEWLVYNEMYVEQ